MIRGSAFAGDRISARAKRGSRTGERYADVVMLWVDSEADKLSLIQDPKSPFFTTERFEGHPSVLVRASRLREIGRVELTELINVRRHFRGLIGLRHVYLRDRRRTVASVWVPEPA